MFLSLYLLHEIERGIEIDFDESICELSQLFVCRIGCFGWSAEFRVLLLLLCMCACMRERFVSQSSLCQFCCVVLCFLMKRKKKEEVLMCVVRAVCFVLILLGEGKSTSELDGINVGWRRIADEDDNADAFT